MLNPGNGRDDSREEHPMVPPHIDRSSSGSSSFFQFFLVNRRLIRSGD